MLALVLVFVSLDLSAASVFRATLLGTGTPRPSMERFGPGILVEVGSEVLLFDAGRGGLQRLDQIGVSYAALTGVFLTHLHSDHVVGLPDLWLCGWLVSQRTTPLPIWGPAGTEKMVAHLREAYQFDLNIRVEDDKAHPDGGKLSASDVGEQVVLSRNGVTVRSFAVDHDPVKPALGFRIDYQGHSLVLSGDTRKSANLVAHAKGVNVLIHEVAAASKVELERPRVRSVIAHHTTATEAAEVFREAGPQLVVYSHIVLRGATVEDVMRDTRKTYAGRVVMGEDLMTIDVVSGRTGQRKRRAA